MKKRLATDESLSTFGGQFVPLRIKTSSNNPAWNRWRQRFSFHGQSIPVLFVIRADGQRLYGQSGALPGDALPTMLAQSQRSGGRVLSKSDQRVLKLAIEQCEQCLADDDLIAAANVLATTESVGQLGNLQSYATLAIRADQLANEIGDRAVGMLSDVTTELEGPNDADGANVRLRRLSKIFRSFPVVGEKLKALVDDQANSQDDAESDSVAMPEVPEVQQAGFQSDFQMLLPVEAFSAEPIRTWTSDNGEFSLTAKLIALNGEKVELLGSDGERFDVDINRLDADHQNYLRQRTAKIHATDQDSNAG